MSVKHVKKYFAQTCEQYHEMKEVLAEIEKDAETNTFSPERLEQIEQDVAHLKENWELWSWVIYLLNMPDNKNKQQNYARENAFLIKDIPSIEESFKVNKETILKLKEDYL